MTDIRVFVLLNWLNMNVERTNRMNKKKWFEQNFDFVDYWIKQQRNASRVRVMNWFANSNSCGFRGSSHAENYAEFSKRFAQIMHISNVYCRFVGIVPFDCLLWAMDLFFFVYCVFRFLLSNIEENVFDFSSKINVDIRKLCLHTKLKEIHAHKSRCWLLISWFGYVRCSEFLYWRMLCVYVIVLFFCFFHRSSLLSWIFNVVPLPLVHLIRFI